MWPFSFVFGARWCASAALSIAGSLASLAGARDWRLAMRLLWLLNFRNYADEAEPYVYVQTLPDINKLSARSARSLRGIR